MNKYYVRYNYEKEGHHELITVVDEDDFYYLVDIDNYLLLPVAEVSLDGIEDYLESVGSIEKKEII